MSELQYVSFLKKSNLEKLDNLKACLKYLNKQNNLPVLLKKNGSSVYLFNQYDFSIDLLYEIADLLKLSKRYRFSSIFITTFNKPDVYKLFSKTARKVKAHLHTQLAYVKLSDIKKKPLIRLSRNTRYVLFCPKTGFKITYIYGRKQAEIIIHILENIGIDWSFSTEEIQSYLLHEPDNPLSMLMDLISSICGSTSVH